MTSDLGIQHPSSLTHRATPVASLTKIWLQLNLNFSKETQITDQNGTNTLHINGIIIPFIPNILRYSWVKQQLAKMLISNQIKGKVRWSKDQLLEQANNCFYPAIIFFYITCTKILILWLVESRSLFQLFIASGDKTSYCTEFGSANMQKLYTIALSIHIFISVQHFQYNLRTFALRMRLIKKH